MYDSNYVSGLRKRYKNRIREVVYLKNTRDLLIEANNKLVVELGQAREVNKELNTEYQILYQEEQAIKEACRYWGKRAEKAERTIKELKEEVGRYKLLYNVAKDVLAISTKYRLRR